ncbi:hypothetical protein Dda_1948 [Drechslerella dactyloides]|uniref:Uncharacterized protein n=1 Tax=Drechslerella dactyloides TaxID=74499 RepID=A0AAD6J4Y8_DREDA|nr:hypothetical protein Dda_1948 [Drechslerella dactyloides]
MLERQFSTTGQAVGWAKFARGKLGGKGVLLDTNILSLILESNKLDGWLRKTASHSQIATCRLNLLEHISSSVIIMDTEHDEIIAGLKAKGVHTIDGPCQSADSTSLACRVLREEFEHQAVEGHVVGWRGKMKQSRVDLAFACEGHTKGFAFVTADANFQAHFAHGLQNEGITTYVVPAGWLRASMVGSPAPYIASK